MATNNSVDVGLSGATGTGNFVGANTPTLITPVLGVATATSVAFSPTTGGIVGTAAADSAGAGFVGQVITSNIPNASAITLTTSATNYNVTSISLTAGDWDVFGNVNIFSTPGLLTTAIGWTSTTSATTPDQSLRSEFSATPAFTAIAMPTPLLRVNVASTTTVYLSAQAIFTSTAPTVCGTIYARRIR